LDTVATALDVKIDGEPKTNSDLRIARPEVGIAPKLSDAELVIMAVLQALLGFTSDSEARFLRHTRTHQRSFFLYVPGQSGYHKRLCKCQVQLNALIRVLAHDTDIFEDDTWVIDSTPVECGLSTDRQTKRPGRFAGYGYCVRAPASSSRYVSSSSRSTIP
jgi:hypothetical protein